MTFDRFLVRGDQLYVRAYGREGPIQLMGARLASAAMRDDWTGDKADRERAVYAGISNTFATATAPLNTLSSRTARET